MLYSVSATQRRITAIVSEAEREFFVVWSALDKIRALTPPGELLHLEAERAAETVLRLMRDAECIDPSLMLDGTGTTQNLNPLPGLSQSHPG
jgi:hypothetical protein